MFNPLPNVLASANEKPTFPLTLSLPRQPGTASAPPIIPPLCRVPHPPKPTLISAPTRESPRRQATRLGKGRGLPRLTPLTMVKLTQLSVTATVLVKLPFRAQLPILGTLIKQGHLLVKLMATQTGQTHIPLLTTTSFFADLQQTQNAGPTQGCIPRQESPLSAYPPFRAE